ncbi:MAG: YHS domain-containing (seleno)protein [Verrucomicrobiota bacterium]
MKNSTTTWLGIITLCVASLTAHAEPTNSAGQSNWSSEKRLDTFNTEDGLGLSGYDPVSYFHGQPTKGKASITSKYNGVTYRFSSTANKQSFDTDPSKFEPAFGGWCAWAMADDGSRVEIDPKSYKIYDGRLYLFYDGFWGDTLAKWNEESAADQKKLSKRADQLWADQGK